jgi:raffinose/stachyose/melibiose transport system permease protein
MRPAETFPSVEGDGVARGSRVAVGYLILLSATAVSFIPTIYLFDLSLRNPTDFFSPALIAGHPTLANYYQVVSNAEVLRYFLNSAVVALGTVALTLVFSLWCGFAVSRLKIRGGQAVFYTILAGLMIPLAGLIVPLTVALKAMGLLNNYLGLIGPETAIGSAFGLLVIKGAMDNFPRELEEAAVIDGATRSRILWQIMVPVLVPSLLVVGIWQFLYSWNEFFLALVVMSAPSMQTVPLMPLAFQGPYMADPGALFAALSIISVVPMVVYAALQRWFVGGLMAGSIKG